MRITILINHLKRCWVNTVMPLESTFTWVHRDCIMATMPKSFIAFLNWQGRELQDVVTCVREKCTIHSAGFRLHPNAERYLKPIEEMTRLFRHYPEALLQTQGIAEACTFSLDQLKYQYPKEITSGGRPPQEELAFLTWQGAQDLFGKIPEKVRATIEYELSFIEQMNYAEYFLTVYDIVRY